MLYNVNAVVGKGQVYVPLEVAVAHFVAVFKLSKFVCLLLDGVVGEMYEFVVELA